MLKKYIDSFLYRFGYVDEREYALRSVKDPQKEKRARGIIKKLYNVSNLSNSSESMKLTSELHGILKESNGIQRIKKDSYLPSVNYLNDGSNNLYGFTPESSRIYDLFPNPFAAYNFAARNHWAVRGALDIIRDEITNDGFYLKTTKGTSKKRLKEVYRLLKKLDINNLRVDIAYQIKLYGNCWILPHKNLLKKPGKLEILAPPRMIPIVDPVTEQIVAWNYKYGRVARTYSAKELLHCMDYSSDGYRELGDPCLGPAMLEIEADLSASNFNNQVFQKAGMMGVVFSIKIPDNDLFSEGADEIVDSIQDVIDSQYVGSKAALSPLVMSNLDKVYNVSPVGKLDSSFENLRMAASKTVSTCLGVPPEKIAVSRSNQAQYVPSLVEDSVNTRLDNTIGTLTYKVDDFINEKILKEILGIEDIRIVAAKRHGAITKNAADIVKLLADAGPIITVDEARSIFLGMDEVDPNQDRGRKILDNSENRDPNSTPQEISPVKDDLNLDKAIDKIIEYDKTFNKHKKIIKNKNYADDSEEVMYLMWKKNNIDYYGY